MMTIKNIPQWNAENAFLQTESAECMRVTYLNADGQAVAVKAHGHGSGGDAQHVEDAGVRKVEAFDDRLWVERRRRGVCRVQ